MPLNDNVKIENANSLSRQRATRSRRDAERKVNDRRKELLQSATSTSERRKIKSGVYDLDTTRTDDNKQGTDERIQNDGIDKLYSPVPSSSGGGSSGVFDGSVLICINGSPYYIDIPYDSGTGAYAASEGANFPISAP